MTLNLCRNTLILSLNFYAVPIGGSVEPQTATTSSSSLHQWWRLWVIHTHTHTHCLPCWHSPFRLISTQAAHLPAKTGLSEELKDAARGQRPECKSKKHVHTSFILSNSLWCAKNKNKKKSFEKKREVAAVNFVNPHEKEPVHAVATSLDNQTQIVNFA